MSLRNYSVAIVGPMGIVGRNVASILEERNFPIKDIKFLGTERNKNREIFFKGNKYYSETAEKGSFTNVDIAFFCVDSIISKTLAPIAVKEGAVVIDNSSQWRMDKEVPLVIPEVNIDALYNHKGLIANPNCSTIQMLMVLKPLHDAFKIKRVIVSTYQSVSGSGKYGMDDLINQITSFIKNESIKNSFYPHEIFSNLIPHIDEFMENGYTKEEMKMVNETKKILDENIMVSATAVRVPVFNCHSESVNIETEKPISPEGAREVLSKFKGVTVIDKPLSQKYPMPILAKGKDEVFVGRIRRDFTLENGINLWIVADNLRKGAALNSVQIAEALIERNLIKGD
jgi:aspartate-semialdehyde dehydrogenase